MTRKSTFLNLLDAYLNNYLPYSIGASPNTIKSYKFAFRLLIEFIYDVKDIPADQITFGILDYNTLSEFFKWIEEVRGCSASTKNQRLAAIASFSLYAQNRDFDAASVFRNNINKIPIKKVRSKQRTILNQEELTILLSLPNESRNTGLRDKVLLSLMYATGARAQEICDITVGNLRFHQNGASINIRGKGGKVRQIGISVNCATLVKRYIEYRKIATLPEKHVFSSQTHEHMTISCIEGIFKKYIAMAKKNHPSMFLAKSYSPHSMRHTTASHMLEAGVPLIVIKNFLGHASLQSTEIYAAISQNTVNKHLKEWNEKWFPNQTITNMESIKKSKYPDFLL